MTPGSPPPAARDPLLAAIGLTAEEAAALLADHVKWAEENRRRQRRALEIAAHWQMP